MITARPLSRSLKQISFGLAALIIVIAAVSLTAIFLQRKELDQFRQEVGRSVDAVSSLSLKLADAQNALMLAASTYDPWLPRIADDAMARVRESIPDLELVAEVTGSSVATTDAAQRLTAWLVASDNVLRADMTARNVASIEYPLAREALIEVTKELEDTRTERRMEHDAIILGGAVAIGAATLAALLLVALMARHYVRRLTRPLTQLRKMVDARVAGDLAIRARTDQGFSEAVRLAVAINELSDFNNGLRATHEATIHSHLLAERVAAHLAVTGSTDGWGRALEALAEGLHLNAVAVLPEGDPSHSALHITPGDQSWLPDPLPIPADAGHAQDSPVAAVALDLGGQPMGTLLVYREGGRWSDSDAEALELSSHHLAASLALESVMEAARALDEDKTRFLATTSHELRTPLTAVVAWLSLLQEGDLGELSADQHHAMGVVERNIARLRDLIEDLLTVNQLDSGQARAVRTHMDMAALACRVVESLTPMADTAGVQLRCQATPCDNNLTVQGDPGQIERAITNITQNALKFTGRDGRVDLNIRCVDGDVTLTCTDTGIGIPADDLPHVLERFRRAGNAHGLPGTGLGLSIVDSIMEAHGGTFLLDSTQGVGTTVVLTLPTQLREPSLVRQ
ncbi:sensor histidine kinase [Tessaracoccus antarcticus]|uniref:Sensor-like histidine kinase SenX3 n=1 Tax=Tessaracoccus antarcticus TaxID=2479848 RepID=A0A3M0FYJ0_9ACTN|nr:HAMP domain-containing sensor histidine kinase [Tessaracoccus antarcticus]RMB57781.1 sensor histidine kinase [Tessaracoccus antarcticus]